MTKPPSATAGYSYVWEFLVAPDKRDDFLRTYGPDGDWVRLFRHGRGYVSTLLFHDRANEARFLTIDRWRRSEDHDAFLAAYEGQYQALDQACEGLAFSEREIGTFWDINDTTAA